MKDHRGWRRRRQMLGTTGRVALDRSGGSAVWIVDETIQARFSEILVTFSACPGE